MSDPELSIAVALQELPADRCLEALVGQREVTSTTLEVLLVDGRGDGAAEELGRRFAEPFARRGIGFEVVRPDGPSLPKLHAAGIEAARAPLVAFTESHCRPDPGWAAAALAAHRAGSSPAVGGAVEPARDLSPLALALFLCDYAAFLPPLAVGSARELPGNNVVFKRQALTRGEGYGDDGFWKSFFCRRLEAEGYTLESDGRLLVRYGRALTPAATFGRRYRHGRCFGAMRAAGLSGRRRVLVALAAPLLPALSTWRTARETWKRRRWRLRLVTLLPLCLLLHAVWCWGEAAGNVAGAAGTCDEL